MFCRGQVHTCVCREEEERGGVVDKRFREGTQNQQSQQCTRQAQGGPERDVPGPGAYVFIGQAGDALGKRPHVYRRHPGFNSCV